MIIVIVGDIYQELADYAKSIDPKATLIDSRNLNLQHGVHYTSLGDLDSTQSLISLFVQADKIIYFPPAIWSDYKAGKSYMQHWTEYYLLYFRDKKQIVGLEKILNKTIELDFVQGRQTNDAQLWIAGCSFSHAVGVSNNERYGQLIADRLNMKVSFLTKPASSIQWAADQILRSNIKENDILVWGLTQFERFYFYDTKINHVNSGFYLQHKEFNNLLPINILDSDHLKYKAIAAIYQVINFCEKNKCKLILAGLLINHNDIFYTSNIPYYTHLNGYFGLDEENFLIDFGDDKKHPGPKMHKWYADQIIKKL